MRPRAASGAAGSSGTGPPAGVDTLSFWDHAEDLRRKILWALAVFAVSFVVLYFFLSFRLTDYLVSLSSRPLYYLSVFEPFLTRVRVSAWTAVFASVPFLLVQVVRFVMPGLRRRERRMLAGMLAFGAVFVAGVGYLLFAFSPTILKLFLDAFASPAVEMHLSISTFITFYLMLAASAFVIVLIPAVTFILLKIGVLRLETVRKSRRYVVPILLFVAAVITPPDPASMLIVYVPLQLVFELSLLAFRLLLRSAPSEP
jgi:sec-independent protein translocase protein TatC